jgi:hypothetical protein
MTQQDQEHVKDVLKFFHPDAAPPSDITDAVGDLAAVMLKQALEASKLMNLVPPPLGLQPGVLWLISQPVQMFWRSPGKKIPESVRKAVAKQSHLSERMMASEAMPPTVLRSKAGTFKMPEGPGHYFGRLLHKNLWGQLPVILFLTSLSERWASAGESDWCFGLGDLNTEDGTPVKSHETHKGFAADIYVIHKRGLHRNDTENQANWRLPDTYDPKRTRKLVELISNLRHCQYPMTQVIYNDLEATKGLPRMETLVNHDEHIHVLMHGETPYSKEQVKTLLKGS